MVTFDLWDFTGSLRYKSVYSCFDCKDSLHLAVFDINTGKYYWLSVSFSLSLFFLPLFSPSFPFPPFFSTLHLTLCIAVFRQVFQRSLLGCRTFSHSPRRGFLLYWSSLISTRVRQGRAERQRRRAGPSGSSTTWL